MRNNHELYAVVKLDGTFAGVPCLSWEEARELSAQHEGSTIFFMDSDCDQVWGADNDHGTLEEDALRVDSFYHHDDEKEWWDDLMKCYNQ